MSRRPPAGLAAVRAARVPDSRRLRVGVIGLGSGCTHIDGWRQHPNVDVVALADADADRLDVAGERFDVATCYTCAETMLDIERFDVISLCTPNRFHKALAIAALEAGCHVLCEKPMALGATEAREMLAAARRNGRRLMVNFPCRFSAQSRALKAQVDAGLFGDFYFGRSVWHRRRGLPDGSRALADLGVHRLDLALWLMGHPRPTWVLGSTHEPTAGGGWAGDVGDLATALIRFDNGATLVLEASRATHIGEAELMETRLFGTRAGLLQKNLDGGPRCEAQIFLEQAGTPCDLHLRPAAPEAPSAMYEFAEAILNERPHPAPGEEGLVVMEILDAICQSARSGEPVRFAA
ncbi:putative dehydrogenase [Plasticicumulans lactativorans]|uniref:Putative dehydrogenase n=1 Tax=Plasticicumulans lactativorans TaxID=1133106 RepID=A0A4R2L4A9_9GAMM|nr:Gfo/Idh/MocA family oxidoreductase [Plasticicumulans lactativorans]TCO82057.1 putative dehydrogenase [Plasticicumulans lactativorans]